MATTTPKELTKSTYITFKPAYKDCNLSPIDLARIAASADGYTVRKNEKGTGWDMRFITHEGIPLPTPMKTGAIEGHITDVTTEGGAWTVIIAGFPTFVKATKADPHNIQTARKFLNLWAN